MHPRRIAVRPASVDAAGAPGDVFPGAEKTKPRARRGSDAPMADRAAQPAGFSFAASVPMSWKSCSSPPAMPTSVTYLPCTTTVGVLEMR